MTDFSFDRAYWMSGLEPADEAKGVARFDGRSLAIPETGHTTLPEAGGPATTDQTGPYAMTGQTWITDRTTSGDTRNAFTASLAGARAVTLSLGRMRLDGHRSLSGDVTTQAPLRLTLCGDLARGIEATLDGKPVAVSQNSKRVAVAIPAGHHDLVLGP